MEDRWEFHSTGMESRPGEAQEFAARIVEAFRVATGIGGAIRWVWETGPTGRVSVAACDSEAGRWIQRVLLASYPVGHWLPSPLGPTTGSAVPVSFAVGVPDGLGPFRSPSDGAASWVEPVLGLLGTYPAGLGLDWELRPITSPPTQRISAPPTELILQPPGFRAGVSPLPRRTLADRLEERRLGPHWMVSGTLVLFGTEATIHDADRFARVVGAASCREGGSGFAFRRRRPLWRGRAPFSILSSSEVASLFPTPAARFTTPAVPAGPSRRLVFGRDSRGLPCSIAIEPGEGRHLLVLGETGMGKSSLLVRLSRQVAAEHNLLVFDPIGDTARSVMAALPSSSLDRVLWVSPAHSPVGINALASLRPGPAGSALRSERALGDLVGALRRVRALRYGDTPFWGPRIEETLTQSLVAAAAIPRGTLVDAERLLSEPGHRAHGIPPEAQASVEELRRRVMERPEEVDGTRRLLSEITRSPVLTRMLCQREPRSSVAEWVRPGRIAVVSGDAGEVGESAARYLLSVLLALVWAELLTTPGTSKTILVLDEAQWYSHDSVAEAFRLGRRRNLHLWLATQALGGLPEAVREAARTNAADLVLYRGSPEEAREFHRWLPSVREETLLALPRGRAVLLNGKGERIEWVTIGPPTQRRTIDLAVEAAAESSRSGWAPAEEDDATATPTPVPGVEAAPRAEADGPKVARPILLVLWAGLLDADPTPSIEVRVAVLRQELDPEGSAVRRAGSELAKVGALSDNRREADGRIWTIERGGLARLLAGGVGAAELATATADWRRIAPRALLDRSRQPFKQQDS